ncbi:hypothetical protein [Corynebacterium crudilactis]|uniref:Uncharacterized protein n=1 Tax=Corynebacterium crudilactis TaxID=1652495 RepID=A0A172QXR4_9CORY|nr:hypothetical protein [Corynebacterium crudilactis]ANE05497.1 hypothetical protein ccrud_14245 [Corynebacterium crudilactis]
MLPHINRQPLFRDSVLGGAVFLGMAVLNHVWSPFEVSSFAVTSFFTTLALVHLMLAVFLSTDWNTVMLVDDADVADVEAPRMAVDDDDLVAVARATNVLVEDSVNEVVAERFAA